MKTGWFGDGAFESVRRPALPEETEPSGFELKEDIDALRACMLVRGLVVVYIGLRVQV